ncbi:MAG: GNAT family N-acetyltransferase [Clostridia bacterium]|nr:GNAT family N-acetyltransferase [Clostridia bacterium]
MVELEKVSKENISAYRRYEEAFQDDLKSYQSRIYPNKSCDILHWYHIKTNNDCIGSIWLEQNTNEDFAVLGIFIADRKYRNKGIGSQAIEKIKEICLPFMLVDKILLRVRAENIRAIACYKKCGFIEDKRYSKHNGIKVIEMVYHHLPQRKQLRLE